MSETTVLVLGGTGYVGQFVVRALLDRPGTRVHVAHRPSRDASFLPEAVRRHGVDLTSAEAVEALLAEVRPAIVVNCAAMSALGACEKDPVGAEAANCPRHFVEALAKSAGGAPRLFVHFSTDIVYAGDPSEVYDEETVPVPVNTYGKLKAEFDAYLAERAEPACIVLRPSNIVGPVHPYASTGTKFLQWLGGQLQKDEPTKVFNDEHRNYTWVEDLVAMVLRLIDAFPSSLPKHRLFICGGPEALTRVDVARSLAEAKGWPLTFRGPDGEERQRLEPAPRASVDLGYPSPLCIRMCSARAEEFLRRRFRSLAECVKEDPSRV
mmetsp:Transcript_58467/g.163823  ORF Transcript_58467/g.163823 Transcript_58467/m.163823 type:complete len:323 (-) Transcript_58467:79-1047(-)